METPDVVGALGRLLAEPPLLALFERDRAAAAEILRVPAATIASWDAEALRRQAAGLVDKRRHEVRRWLPRGCALLYDREEEVFRDFAAAYWPTGHRRHAVDALAFWRYLRALRHPAARPEEGTRLAALLGRWPFSIRIVRDYPARRGSRLALFIAWRRRGAIRHLAFFRA